MANTDLTIDELAALEIGQQAPNGGIVRSYMSYGMDSLNTMVEVSTTHGLYRQYAPTLDLSDIGLGSLMSGDLVLASSFMRRGLMLARVRSIRSRSVSVMWMDSHPDPSQNHASLWVTPNALPYEQVVPIPSSINYAAISEARSHWSEAYTVGVRSKGAQATRGLVDRVDWLLNLFQVRPQFNNPVLYNPNNAWMLALVHPSPEDYRLVFAPTDVKSIERPRYVRMSTALKSLIRAHGVQLPDGWSIEDVSYAWSELMPQNYSRWKIEVVSGQDLRDTYNDDHTPGSCMVRVPYTKWYADNPNVCSIIRVIDNSCGELYGRALLWTDVNGQRWYDRIYPTDGGQHAGAIERWANANGIRQVNSTRDPVVVRMRPSRWGYPYMDNLMYATGYRSTDESILISNRDVINGTSAGYQFRSTSGTIYSYGRSRYIEPDVLETPPDGIRGDCWTCVRCGDEHDDEDDGTTLCSGWHCDHCVSYHCDQCDSCSRDVYPDDWAECERCGHEVREANGDDRDGFFYCDSCCEDYDNELVCNECSDRFADESDGRTIDDAWYCNRCANTIEAESESENNEVNHAHTA